MKITLPLIMEEIIIFLPSNVKSEYYENTITKFKTKLAAPIQLDGDWEVGLANISYTKSWDLKTEKGIIDLIAYDKEAEFEVSEKFLEINLSNLTDIKMLVDLINDSIDKKKVKEKLDFHLPSLILHEKFGRVEMKLGIRNHGLCLFKFSKNLNKFLGFDEDLLEKYYRDTERDYKTKFQNTLNTFVKFDSDVKKNWSPREITPKDGVYSIFSHSRFNFNPDINNLFVYCDIIKPNFVGNDMEPLIRIVGVPHESRYKEEIRENFIDIHFHPLNTNYIESIEIDIKDENKKPIPFQFGRTIVELHFRKKWNNT